MLFTGAGRSPRSASPGAEPVRSIPGEEHGVRHLRAGSLAGVFLVLAKNVDLLADGGLEHELEKSVVRYEAIF